ncbi:MAG TPA: Gldg family protein [Gammaproteobacteria bacterium]|nr:Gldg family protein [Gammaproteobacteria bacterium]
MNYRNIISGTGLVLAACLFVALIIVVNATLTSWRLDLTENKLFTLSDGTINILNRLEEPVRLDFYFSQKTLTGLPALTNYGNRVRDLLLEYKNHAGDKIELNVIDPETFSEEEDQAVASGLRGIAVNNAGDRAYLGLVGTNSTDDERVIPFFNSEKESSLEYDITKLIYSLAHPKKRVIGVITTLPMFGDEDDPNVQPWTIISTMEEFFEVRQLDIDSGDIGNDIDVLMVVHPKDLKLRTRFAIDQYVLKGGKAMVFVDPMSEADPVRPNPESPGTLPDFDSELPALLKQWGVMIPEQKIAGDINAAMHVQTRSERGPREIAYLPWLRLAKESFNQEDFATSELNVIHMGTAGIIEKLPEATTTVTPLIKTTRQSMQLDRDFLVIQRDPSIILDNFKSMEKKQVLAARLQGHAKTAFPDGISTTDTSSDADAAGSTKKKEVATATGDITREGDINVILVADTDILSDLFWIRQQSYFGVDLPQPIADNGNFIVNALDNLSGSNDLINLRTRGEFTRPFERVEAIRRDAELKFREREQELQARLKETEQKIREFLQNQGEESSQILTPEQNKEMEKYRQIRVETRKELRAVQHELKKNIEHLGTWLRVINIGLIPLLIIIIAIITGMYRINRRKD